MPQPEMMKMRLALGCHPTSELSMLNESESYLKHHVHNKTSIHGEELTTEIIPVVKELNTAQYAWCRDDTELYVWCSLNTRGQEVPQ